MDAMDVPDDDLTVNPAKTRRYKFFIHYVGEHTRKILKNLENNGMLKKNLSAAKICLDSYFSPRLNRVFQLNVLSNITQEEDESMDSFFHRVKKQIQDMSLDVVSKNELIEFMTISQLVNKTNNLQIKRKAIKDNQNLKELLNSARSFELTDHQMSKMASPTPEPAC